MEHEKVTFVCHCILNQSTGARWGSGGASRETAMISDVFRLLMSKGVGIMQMDCPEFGLYGDPRTSKIEGIL